MEMVNLKLETMLHLQKIKVLDGLKMKEVEQKLLHGFLVINFMLVQLVEV
jgi:hypothetical protein